MHFGTSGTRHSFARSSASSTHTYAECRGDFVQSCWRKSEVDLDAITRGIAVVTPDVDPRREAEPLVVRREAQTCLTGKAGATLCSTAMLRP